MKIDIMPINIKFEENLQKTDLYLILKYNGIEFYS